MQVAGFKGSAFEDLLTLQYLQAKTAREMLHARIFLLIFLLKINHQRTHFYRLALNVFFRFPDQAICQVGIFNLPVGLA